MKAGIMGSSIFVMGVDPGTTSGVTIIGANYLSMYSTSPYRQTYIETFETSGSPTSQALEIADATREFFPLALVLDESNNPSALRVGERIAFCVETSYILCPLFRQPTYQAMKSASGHEEMSMRHAITFLSRCHADQALRDSAWGPAQRQATRRTRPNGSRRSARRV